MADDDLAGLSRNSLLELVRRQQEELAAREAAIERRDAKIRELEEELSQFRRPAKTPENSSMPPSQARKANRVAGRRKARPSSPPLASRPETSWTPSAPSLAPRPFRLSQSARRPYVADAV